MRNVAAFACFVPLFAVLAFPQQPLQPNSLPAKDSVTYINKHYRFGVTLPGTWKGYAVLQRAWCEKSGRSGKTQGVARCPIIVLRNPKWTEKQHYEDIPIMIFTLAEWKKVESGDLVVSGAPFPPGELARNRDYVFALPPRYNYDFAEGWEEVQKLLSGDAVHVY